MTNMLLLLGRIILSVGLGLFVGYERESQNKPAGIRDVTLVTLGACIFTIIAYKISALNSGNDLGRIMSYTIASIGFLGSGVIIQNKKDVEGITTAAVLWAMVSVGMLCAMNELILAIFIAFLIYLILKFKHLSIKLSEFNEKRRNKTKK